MMKVSTILFPLLLWETTCPSDAAAAAAAAATTASNHHHHHHHHQDDTVSTSTAVADVVVESSSANAKQLRTLQQQSNDSIYIAGAFDTKNFDWGEELFNFTISMLNNRSDGWYDDIFENEEIAIDWAVQDAACDAGVATRAYWDLRRPTSVPVMHGLVGCRCSDASIAVARIAGLENIPQVSPTSTSSRLSDDEEFPFFSRVVAPDDASGGVGALVAMLRSFEWNRVSIITTDTAYAKDLANEFVRLWRVEDSEANWEGDIASFGTITLDESGAVDYESIRQILEGVPNDPASKSRVILLVAHNHHSYPILEFAAETNFQPDTIWIGPDSWVGRPPIETDWIPTFPGYLGVMPYRNKDAYYQEYLQRLQAAQRAEGRPVWSSLPDYAAEYMVDSIVVLAKALSLTPPDFRHDGSMVSNALRDVTLNGVSGYVSFTEHGDRADPLFTIANFQQLPNGEYAWVDVGSVGTTPGSAVLNDGIEGICFAEVGCGLSEAPLDSYPVPRERVETWVIVIISLISAVLLIVAYKYWAAKAEITDIQKKMEAMQKIDSELDDLGAQVEAAKEKQASLIRKRAELQQTPDTWTDSDQILVEVDPTDDQYWQVSDRLQATMSDAHISKLWRVQNTSLWTYYSFHKDRLEMHGVDPNEHSVWHGTSSLDPAIIYNDRQDGFMMQFSQKGFWGRGIYFADKSAYSYHYSHGPKPSLSSFFSTSTEERPGAKDDEHEMFLAKLLVGNAILMDRDESSAKAAECRDLTVPPTDTKTNLKYNTVTGYTNGSQVWIVYENGRAYPDYLVRYYRGSRDKKRTPFRSKKEAMKKSESKGNIWASISPPEEATPAMSDSVTNGSRDENVLWEYKDNTGWSPYSDEHQSLVERAYQLFMASKSKASNKILIKTDEWEYEVDVDRMVQTNLQHHARTGRDVRRRII